MEYQYHNKLRRESDMNQVKPRMTLVGLVSRDAKTHKSLTNTEKLANVKNYVDQYFWCCEPYVQNEDRLLDEHHPYPLFFSAGWFVIDTGPELKQALIVVHGDSMEDANKRLISAANKVDWS
jgi:hypothetical protein